MQTREFTSARQSHPGLLTALMVISALALYSFSPAPLFVKHSRHVQQTFLLVAFIATAYGSVFLVKSSEAITRWKLLVSSITALLLATSVAAYLLYTAVPLKHILQWHLDRAATLSMWFGADVAGLALLGSFLATDKSRIPFAVGGTLLLIIWCTK